MYEKYEDNDNAAAAAAAAFAKNGATTTVVVSLLVDDELPFLLVEAICNNSLTSSYNFLNVCARLNNNKNNLGGSVRNGNF